MVIIELLASLFQSILNVHFILKFNGGRWKGNVPAFIAASAIFAVTITGDFLFPGFSVAISSFILGISIVFALLICNKHYITAIISACIYEMTLILIGSTAYMFMSMLLKDFDGLMQGEKNIGRLIYLIVINLLLCATLRLILHFIVVKDSHDIKIGLIAFSLSVITLVGLGAAMTLTEFDFVDAIQYQIMIFTCTYVAINVVVYFLIYQIQRLQKAKYEAQ